MAERKFPPLSPVKFQGQVEPLLRLEVYKIAIKD